MLFLPEDIWEIKTTQHKGRGVFTKKDIPAGTIIGDYLGKIISIADEDKYEEDHGLYLMYYNERATIFPQPSTPGIHLINHSCEPNTWMYTYKGHTLYFALRHIFAGEELTVSYLLGPDEDCNPCSHICHCGSRVCTGTMHAEKKFYDKWDAFNTEVSKKTKREPVTIGKKLPRLQLYPENIADAPVYPLFGATDQPPLTISDTKIPSVSELRNLLRTSGRQLFFPKLNTKVLGILNDNIVSESA